MNTLADADTETMRISIDTKATVHVGEYSRGGRSRGIVAVKALDHDMYTKEKLLPGGILEPATGRSFLFFGTSRKTSDFMVDGMRTVARLLDAPYEKGVKVCGNEKIELEQRLQRSTALHWWDITIHPKMVLL